MFTVLGFRHNSFTIFIFYSKLFPDYVHHVECIFWELVVIFSNKNLIQEPNISLTRSFVNGALRVYLKKETFTSENTKQ